MDPTSLIQSGGTTAEVQDGKVVDTGAVSKAPIEAVLDDKPFSEDAFKNMSPTEDSIKPAKVEETPKKLEEPTKKAETPGVKEEVKPKEESKDKEEETPKEEVVEEVEEFVPQPLQKDKLPKNRDYSGLTEQEQLLAKRMSNEAFAYVKPRLQELAKLKQEYKELETKFLNTSSKNTLPDSYLEHDQAFILDAEYQQAVNNIGQLQGEANFIEEQLIKCKNGDSWTNIEGYGQDGKPILKEYAPGPKAELYLSNLYTRAQFNIQQNQAFAQNFVKEFKGQQEQRKALISKFEKDYFPMYEDPKFLESNKYAKGMMNLAKNFKMTSVPLSTFCKVYAFAMETINESKTAEKEKALAEIQTKAGPSSSEINTGVKPKVAPKDLDEVPFDSVGFERMKA